MPQITIEEAQARILQVPHWYHRIEVYPGVVTPGVNDSPGCLRKLDLPPDLTGCRVLDIGTRDGFFAFECERRGASEIVALDYMPASSTGFPVAADLLGSKVPYVQDNLYNIAPEKYGYFDLVIFLGVLYHLPDPMAALNLLRQVCRGSLVLETFVIDENLVLGDGRRTSIADLSPDLRDVPLMQFFPRGALNNDMTNYWGPNVRCVEAMLAENNFLTLATKHTGDRAVFNCEIVDDRELARYNTIARGLPDQ